MKEESDMDEYRPDPAKDFVDNMTLLLMKYGVDAAEARAELAFQLRNIELVPKCTDLIPYEGDVNEALVKRFIISKKIKGCTDRTLKKYYGDIMRACGVIRKPLTQVTSEDIQLYIAYCMRNGNAKQTIDGRRLSLSTFYTWATREGVVKENPMNRVDKIKFNPRREEAFKVEEVEKMRAELKTWREKAIFETLLSTGCRVTELVNIMLDDINGEEINVLGKGEKYRTVYLNAKAELAIERYLNERKDANPYLFPACKRTDGEALGLVGQYVRRHKGYIREDMVNWYQDADLVDPHLQMDIGSVRQLVSRVGQKAGVDNVHPHRFRRTCATLALQKGMPLELVSKMLGHNQLDTTKIYLTLNEEDLRYAHKKYVT